jgi:predicted DNA-binding transcriptional regulator AlpA
MMIKRDAIAITSTSTNEVENLAALPLFLTAADVGKILGLGRSLAYRTIHSPGFPRMLIGLPGKRKLIIVPRDEFITWINTNTVVDVATEPQ